jgi:hypothetical protein
MKKNHIKNNLSDSESDNSEDTVISEASCNKNKPEFVIVNPLEYFSTKELCHYKNIDKYFKETFETNKKNFLQMIDIIEGNSNISLRILDWFVTKYSKKRGTSDDKNAEVFDIKISYKAQLKSYKKRNFDPFRRRKKFFYPCTEEGYKIDGENKHIYTTLGQLNFFKWAFSNNIIAFVDENLSHIVSEMNAYNRDEKKKKNQQNEETETKLVKVKKTEGKIKVNATKKVERDEIKLTLVFD